jgi:hypothetical protein
MYAHVNLPGSSHFATFGPATRGECERWLKKMENHYKELHGGLWYNCYAPDGIIPNAEAMRWKYRDGSKVFRE